jgi:predicted DCC family thiol-disulfide oxidoreductase YuxK
MNLVHRNASAEVLGACRIAIFGVWLLILLRSPLPQVTDFPVEWLTRLGFMGLVPRGVLPVLLEPAVLWGIYMSMCGPCALVMLGVRPFLPFALALAALLTLNEALLKGFSGYPSHTQSVALYSAWVLAIFPAADGLSLFGRRRESRNPALYQAALVVMILSMAFTIFFDNTILNFIAARTAEYSEYGFTFGLSVLDSWLLSVGAKVGYFLVTLFEVLAPLVIFSTRFRYVWLVFMGTFHVGCLLTMNIFFWENLLIMGALLTPLPYLFARQEDRIAAMNPGPDEASPSLARLPLEPRNSEDVPLPVLFYDGECGLCNSFVQWVLRRDKQGRFRFAPLQGKTAERMIGLPQGAAERWSVVLVDEAGVHVRSEASLRTVIGLGGMWGAAAVLLWIPRIVRDTVYEFIARHRYRWFGKVDACRLPTPEERSRFLA